MIAVILRNGTNAVWAKEFLLIEHISQQAAEFFLVNQRKKQKSAGRLLQDGTDRRFLVGGDFPRSRLRARHLDHQFRMLAYEPFESLIELLTLFPLDIAYRDGFDRKDRHDTLKRSHLQWHERTGRQTENVVVKTVSIVPEIGKF